MDVAAIRLDAEAGFPLSAARARALLNALDAKDRENERLRTTLRDIADGLDNLNRYRAENGGGRFIRLDDWRDAARAVLAERGEDG